MTKVCPNVLHLLIFPIRLALDFLEDFVRKPSMFFY